MLDVIGGIGAVVAEVWTRATTPQPAPSTTVVWLTAGCALVVLAVPPLWLRARHGLTVVHEGAHAAVAVLTGRRLHGVRLHSDTSGVTVSSGRRRGPGAALTAAVGYPAPALLGVAAAWLLGRGYAVGLLWALLACLLVLLPMVRNGYGLWVVLGGAAALFAATWWAPTAWQVAVAATTTWFLLLGAPRAVIELQAQRGRDRRAGRRAGSDADQLARLTGLPGVVWVGVFLLVSLAALALGARWLLDGADLLAAVPGR